MLSNSRNRLIHMTQGILRKAVPEDVKGIKALIDQNLDKLLPRSCAELAEMIDMFWVVESDGEIVGCCCLEVYSPKIAELRTLAVRSDQRGHGYGEALVKVAVEEAQRLNIRQVLVVTSTPEFFEKLNFGVALNEKYALFWNGTGSAHVPAPDSSDSPDR
jgi:amino-acid N-acetyltransferase